jgi:hypothetical protein
VVERVVEEFYNTCCKAGVCYLGGMQLRWVESAFYA